MASGKPRGLIAVDKQGDALLKLDPVSLQVTARLTDLPDLPHELAISPDRTRAYVPAYGSGIHGDNPHPNHLVSIIDLDAFERLPDIDLSPLKAPHTLRFGADGLLYVTCEDSARIAVCDTRTGRVRATIETGSTNAHRLTVLSRSGLICTDNEEDASISFIDIASRKLLTRIALPHPIAGIDAAPDERTLAVSSAKAPAITFLNPHDGQMTGTLPLEGHRGPAQVVRYSPDGRWLLVVGDHEPVVTLIETANGRQHTVGVGEKPMDGAFHPDGKTLLVANETSGTISEIDLTEYRVTREVPCGTGCETLGYF